MLCKYCTEYTDGDKCKNPICIGVYQNPVDLILNYYNTVSPWWQGFFKGIKYTYPICMLTCLVLAIIFIAINPYFSFIFMKTLFFSVIIPLSFLLCFIIAYYIVFAYIYFFKRLYEIWKKEK